MTKKPIYRPGDRVVIMQPKVFVRCGYPFDIMTETDSILTHYRTDIEQLIEKIDQHGQPSHYGFDPDIRAVASRLARIVAVRRGYDGNDRRIYTKFESGILGKEGTVYSKRVVKTGTRRSSRVYDDEWQMMLSDEKTHVILRVYGTGVTMFEIEAANVRHVTE